MLACLDVIAVKACKSLAERADELLFTAAVYKKVVGGYAGLSCVECLSPGDASCCNLHIGILVQDTRALASELKHHRGDVPCGGGHYLAAKFGATREENDIETLVQ